MLPHNIIWPVSEMRQWAIKNSKVRKVSSFLFFAHLCGKMCDDLKKKKKPFLRSPKIVFPEFAAMR